MSPEIQKFHQAVIELKEVVDKLYPKRTWRTKPINEWTPEDVREYERDNERPS